MTHIGVAVDRLTNLVTMQLKNDNSSQSFYFDRNPTAPFTIPAGFCFIITDVFVNPEITSYSGNQFFFVVITASGARSISVRCDGRTAHIPMVAGVVVPRTPLAGGAKVLDVRNTTFSAGPVEVQLLGYFEKESSAPPVGQPFVP